MFIGIRETHGRGQINDLLKWIEGQGLCAHVSKSANTTIIGLIGDTAKIDMGLLLSFDIIESISGIQETHMNAHHGFHSLDSVIDAYDQNF